MDTKNIIKSEYSDVMKKSYIDYSMSVITARALPDIRDGLKPVQRRILYDMGQLHVDYDKPHKKVARIVGDTMGKYHPHGDSSISDALVTMAQDFKKGIVLVDGHGNFGSIEGDTHAAQRYIECKLTRVAQENMLSDLDKNVVDFTSNYDGTEKEPVVLPVKFVNILANGSEGIAVGMTTNIPTHNIGELSDGCIAYLNNEDITTEKLMKYIPGPDFPTGGIIVNTSDLVNIYNTGQGKIRIRGKVVFEPGKTKKDIDKLVITEIPYTMIGLGISNFISDMIKLIENKTITSVTDITNESSKEGIRIVLHLKKNADVENLTNILYKKTKLEDTYNVNMLAIDNGKPETFSLRDIISKHIEFRYECTTRKYQTLLNKELGIREIKEGLIKACDVVDVIIEMLRTCLNVNDAKNCLCNGDIGPCKFSTEKAKKIAENFRFTEAQATAILEMRLQKLIGLEIEALKQEYDTCCKKIDEYNNILSNKDVMKELLKSEYKQIKKAYGQDRKTELTNAAEVVLKKEEFTPEPVVFLMDRFYYVKIIDKNAFDRNQDAMTEYKYVLSCNNNDNVCIFTNSGQMHQVKLRELPISKIKDRGVPLDNITNYNSSDEEIIYIDLLRSMIMKRLIFVTKQGLIKSVDATEFDVIKKCVTTTKLLDKDSLISIIPITYPSDITFVTLNTNKNVQLSFKISEIPEMKKTSTGSKGITLEKNDFVTNIEPGQFYYEEFFKIQHRAGKGIKQKK